MKISRAFQMNRDHLDWKKRDPILQNLASNKPDQRGQRPRSPSIPETSDRSKTDAPLEPLHLSFRISNPPLEKLTCGPTAGPTEVAPGVHVTTTGNVTVAATAAEAHR